MPDGLGATKKEVPIIRSTFITTLVGASLALGLAPTATGAHVRGCSTSKCDRAVIASCKASPKCRQRVKLAHWRRVAKPYWSEFNAIAGCESHRHWHLRPYGGLGFMPSSWRDFHGRTVASDATKLEQIYRAVLVMKRYGWNAWPVCRRAAGR